MTLWWIGDIVLLVVILPGRRLPAQRRAERGEEHRPERAADRRGRRPRGRRTSTPTALLLTTQDQVQQTVAGVANYGGSLDVILDDAQED